MTFLPRAAAAFLAWGACSLSAARADEPLPGWLRAGPATGALVIEGAGFGNDGAAKPERIGIGLLFDQETPGGVRSADQAAPGALSPSPVPGTAFAGTFGFPGGDHPFALRETLASRPSGEVALGIAVESQAPVAQKTLCLNVLLNRRFQGRTVLFDGKAVAVPERVGETCLFFTPAGGGVGRIVIPLLGGKLSIRGEKLGVLFCQYPNGEASLRLFLVPQRTPVQSAKLDVALAFEPYETSSLDLAPAANRGFRDDDAARKTGPGGWTGQGPRNDLGGFPVGDQAFGQIPFRIVDPAANGGRSCLVLGDASRGPFAPAAEVPAAGQSFAWLYLLHAAAWIPEGGAADCGRIDVSYADGTSQRIDVRTLRDVGNWWEPQGLPNAAVVWRRTQDGLPKVGLYLSRFHVGNRPIASLRFSAAGQAAWMVVAVAGMKDETTPPPPSDFVPPVAYVTQADEAWRPFPFSKGVLEGSALDLSFLGDAPAGKYGPVRIEGGKFVFRDRPGQPVRFFGANLCFGAVTDLDHGQAEEVARRLAAMGYNAVRLHHFDDLLYKEGPDGPDLDPQRLERMDYLISRLEAHGLYLVTDLYVDRLQGFPAKFDDLNQVKYAAAFSPEIMANLERFAKRLLTHVNPYTKVALKDDPALATLNVVNENTLMTHYTLEKINGNAYLKAAFEASFRDWCRESGVAVPAAPDADLGLLGRFFLARQAGSYQAFAAFVRSLGMEKPLTDMNHRSLMVQAAVRDGFDFVENHRYYDHPSFTGVPFQSSTINDDRNPVAELGDVLECGVPRIFGRPFMVTEWNFCYPNRYRSESGAVMGAYAGLQDWDGLFRFDYATDVRSAFGDTRVGTFDVATDPIQFLSERIAALLFRRGDVRAAGKGVAFAVTPGIGALPAAGDYFFGDRFGNAWIPQKFCDIGTYCRIGSALVKPGSPLPPVAALVSPEAIPSAVPAGDDGGAARLVQAGVLDPRSFAPADGRFRSETGQIDADAKSGTFRVVTAQSECLVQSGPSQDGDCLRVRKNTGFSTVFAASLDGQPLGKSARFLVLHLPDLRSSGEKREEIRGKVMIARGTGTYPPLIRKASAEIGLRTDRDKPPAVWALAPTGERLKALPCRIEEGRAVFTVSTDMGEIAPLAYEIDWNAATP